MSPTPPSTGPDDRCPDCRSPRVVSDDRDGRYCAQCGLVLDDVVIDHGPEWRAFDAAERDERARTGTPPRALLPGKGLSTTISRKGGKEGPADRGRYRRMRAWHRRFTGSHDGSIAYGLSEIWRMKAQLDLPESVQERAAVLFRRARGEDLIRGRSIEGAAAACLYAACRERSIARTLEEVAGTARCPRREIARAYRRLDREFELALPPVPAEDYVARFASRLGLDAPAWRMATEILRDARVANVGQGKDPAGLAAAALYLGSRRAGQTRSQGDVADAAGISEVTLRHRYHELDELSEEE